MVCSLAASQSRLLVLLILMCFDAAQIHARRADRHHPRFAWALVVALLRVPVPRATQARLVLQLQSRTFPVHPCGLLARKCVAAPACRLVACPVPATTMQCWVSEGLALRCWGRSDVEPWPLRAFSEPQRGTGQLFGIN